MYIARCLWCRQNENQNPCCCSRCCVVMVPSKNKIGQQGTNQIKYSMMVSNAFIGESLLAVQTPLPSFHYPSITNHYFPGDTWRGKQLCMA